MAENSNSKVIDYIMVTKGKGHWDGFGSLIPNSQSTLITHGVIKDLSLKDGPWPETAKTLFIKLNDLNSSKRVGSINVLQLLLQVMLIIEITNII